MTAVRSDHAALLQAVLESPEDDAPRLVLADWLEEHGEEARGQFIRVQVELARVPAAVYGQFDPWAPERRRERELWESFKKQRWGEVSGWFPAQVIDGDFDEVAAVKFTRGQVVYRRGFVAEIAAPLASLIGARCERCVGVGVQTCDRCSGEGCSVYGLATNGPCTSGLPCPACSGSGRTPGVLAGVLQSHPVTAVRVSDRRAWTGESTGHGYGWSRIPKRTPGVTDDPYHQGGHWIPSDVFDCLPEGWGDEYLRYYPNETCAVAALSTALLSHARLTPR